MFDCLCQNVKIKPTPLVTEIILLCLALLLIDQPNDLFYFFTADILACHAGKAGVTDNIKK